jgi:uncharacterized protein YkwD
MTALLVRPSPARPAGSRRLAALVATASAAVLAVAGLVAAPGAQAASSSTSEQQFVSSINAARQAAGHRALSTSSDLTAVARAWAARMGSSNTLKHNPNLTSQVTNWRYAGENVGVGGDVSSLHKAFMDSAPHKANILDRDYTQVGVGVAMASGRMWVVEVFRTPASTSASSRVLSTTKATTSHHRVYRVGSRGSVVKQIQRVVGTRADGIFGPKTRDAVKRWQKRHHYRVNGFVTAATRRAMHI